MLSREMARTLQSGRLVLISSFLPITTTNRITTGAGTCAFQIHVNFSHAHVSEAVERTAGLSSGFESCYVLLINANTDAVRNFQASIEKCSCNFQETSTAILFDGRFAGWEFGALLRR